MAQLDFAASDWYHKIPISLFLLSELDIFMITGFSNPWKPVFIHFIQQKDFKKYKKHDGNILETYYFPYLNFSETQKFDIF